MMLKTDVSVCVRVCVGLLQFFKAGIILLYMPNQGYNCTVWLIQYSYAVDYYFMIYTAHFFALILPHNVQYTHVRSDKIHVLIICSAEI